MSFSYSLLMHLMSILKAYYRSGLFCVFLVIFVINLINIVTLICKFISLKQWSFVMLVLRFQGNPLHPHFVAFLGPCGQIPSWVTGAPMPRYLLLKGHVCAGAHGEVTAHLFASLGTQF